MANVNYLPLVGGVLVALTGSAGAAGLGLTTTAAGFLAVLAAMARIVVRPSSLAFLTGQLLMLQSSIHATPSLMARGAVLRA